MFKYVCTRDAYTALVGLAHVSGIKVVAGYCCCSFFSLCLCVLVFVRVKKNELSIKAPPQMFTAIHACVSVFAQLDSVLSVGGGNLFVFMMSAAA